MCIYDHIVHIWAWSICEGGRLDRFVVCISTCVCIYICIYSHICIYIYVYAYLCMFMHMYAHTYTYIYTHSGLYIYAYINIKESKHKRTIAF